MSKIKHTTEKALEMLRTLPRVSIGNIRDNPNSKKPQKRGRAQHSGDKHGAGNKGSNQRQNYIRLGYETGNAPFYLRFSYEPYYKGHHLKREYPPISLHQLQKMIDTNRIDASNPVDLTTICNTGLFQIRPDQLHHGVQITDEGADEFRAKVNLEVQHAPELVIAAIERNGGVIRTAYYDPHSLYAVVNPKKWFEKGVPIPRRMLPPQDAVEYYTDAKNRGYLADPEEISRERLVLAQKYGYALPKIEEDPEYEMLTQTKDPRQIFYGLNPGWVVSLKDRAIIKAKGGDFFDAKYNGYGKLKNAPGTGSAQQYFKYQGYFKDDKYSGFGTLTTSSYQYNGDFVNDLKEGFGVVEDSINGVKYIGMFANDKKYGNGILITTNGTYYAGLFANDVLSNSAGGLAIFPSGIYYKGELTIDGPNGKGTFYYPEREVESESFELDDTNTKMSGHTMTGTFAGTWENVRISNGSMAMNQRFNKVPILDLKINAERKWASIFSCFLQSVFGTSDISKIRSMDVKRIWNKIAIYISRAKRKEQLKSNNFETKIAEFNENSAAEICQSGFRLTTLSATSLRSSISDSKLSLNTTPNGTLNGDTLAALDNISVRSFSSITSREYDDDFMLNPSANQSRTSPFRDLDIIPDFCITSLNQQGLALLRDYLGEAFRNQHHPLHQLFEKLSSCFYSTYSCWKFTPNSILCEPAMNEWISIVSRIYTLVVTVMFPALPKDSTVVDGELLSYQTLLYPILMTQGIYSALFVLYASKCSKNDEIYRQRILICEKKTDENLIQLLDINRELIPIIQSSLYQQAIESLNRFKEKCCPSEMMKHINEAFELVNDASRQYDSTFSIAADSLLELAILLIIKANIPQLGAEISLLEDLMQNDAYGGDYHSSTQNDYCLTTLKASYQHIISDNFFVNKIFDGGSP